MRAKETVAQVTHVRHGKPDFPMDRIYCDSKEDPPLNPVGVEQARFAAAFFCDEQVDAIYASPCQRTLMTAEIIAAEVGKPIAVVERLKERKFGIWEGLYFEEIARNYPEEQLAWKKDPIGFSPEGAETMDELVCRVKSEIDKIVARHLGERVLIVSHVGPIRVSLVDALGMPVANYRQLTIDYGSMSRVDYGRRQNNLMYMNAVNRFASP